VEVAGDREERAEGFRRCSRPEGLSARVLAIGDHYERRGEGWRARRGGAWLFIAGRGARRALWRRRDAGHGAGGRTPRWLSAGGREDKSEQGIECAKRWLRKKKTSGISLWPHGPHSAAMAWRPPGASPARAKALEGLGVTQGRCRHERTSCCGAGVSLGRDPSLEQHRARRQACQRRAHPSACH
jgi:hypothetical protein